MLRLQIGLLLVSVVCFAGCGGSGSDSAQPLDTQNVSGTNPGAAPAGNEGQESVSLSLPGGVDIKIGEAEGVSVKAPGVDIKTNEKDGVQVKTPNANLRVNEEEGLKLNAPQTNVSIDDKDGVNIDAPNVKVKTKTGDN